MCNIVTHFEAAHARKIIVLIYEHRFKNIPIFVTKKERMGKLCSYAFEEKIEFLIFGLLN